MSRWEIFVDAAPCLQRYAVLQAGLAACVARKRGGRKPTPSPSKEGSCGAREEGARLQRGQVQPCLSGIEVVSS